MDLERQMDLDKPAATADFRMGVGSAVVEAGRCDVGSGLGPVSWSVGDGTRPPWQGWAERRRSHRCRTEMGRDERRGDNLDHGEADLVGDELDR
jgi:hypothetical protein